MIRTLLNRNLQDAAQPATSVTIETAHLKIDPEIRKAWIKHANEPILLDLGGKEFDLLVKLAGGRKGRVWDRQSLLDSVWGEDYSGTEEIITSCVKRLRSKLRIQSDGLLDCIKTHSGIGYSFEDSEA